MSAFRDSDRPETWINEPPHKKNGKTKTNGHDKDHPVAALECINLEPIGASKIPPRQWAYGNFLLFGSAGVIGAVDGAGKGAIAVVMALAMITGRPLLGEKIWRTGPVAIISYEDDEAEWHRRIAAACLHFEADYADVMAKIYFIRRPGGRVVFAERAATGKTMFPDSEAIIANLRRIDAVLLIVDPFNHAHAMDDGNSNVLIARVADEISRIAREAQSAALVLHHLRKGAIGSVDDLMGATSLRATFRSCRILARMTAEAASALGVTDEHWRYLRIAGTKANYAPPPDQETWFKLASVKLGNGSGIYDMGDQVGVATTWDAPSAFDGISTIVLRRIFDQLRGEPEPGWFYAPGSRSKHWAGEVIVKEAGRTDKQAATVLKTWTDNGVLTVETYKNPNRDDAKKVVLNEGKVTEILGGAASFDGEEE